MDYYPPLYPNNYYHIYNRGNNGENLFYKQENYFYFLRQYDYYLRDYLDTFAYCLLPNHFHLLVRIKAEEEFPKSSDAIPERDGIAIRDGIALPSLRVSKQFRKLFIGYAQAINKQQSRTGSLFQKNFKRKQADNEHYFSQLIYYIHANPQLHGIADDFKNYPYSSYDSLLSDKPTKLFRNETIDWFGSKEAFRSFHSDSQNTKVINNWMIEED